MGKEELKDLAFKEPLKFEREGYFSEFTADKTVLTFTDLREVQKDRSKVILSC